MPGSLDLSLPFSSSPGAWGWVAFGGRREDTEGWVGGGREAAVSWVSYEVSVVRGK